MMRLTRKLLRSGFTVIELLIVIVVIGILATLVIVSYNGVQQGAKDKSLLSDASAVADEITRYSTKNNGVLGSAVAWYSGGSANPNIKFSPSSGNVIDVVATPTDYCIRVYNPGSNKKTISTAQTKESSSGVCALLSPSIAAGGSGNTILAWWKLNGDTLDSSGNSQHGSATAGATPTTGQNGVANNAYSFNGTSGEIAIPDSPTLSPTSSLSLTAWAKVTAFTGAIQGIVAKDVQPGIGNGPYRFEVSASNPFVAGGTSAGNFQKTAFCTGVVTTVLGNWYFLVMTFDGANMTMYANDTLCATTTLTDTVDTSGVLRIGQQKTTYNRWFNGSIDDVRLYSKALTVSEIHALYIAGAK